jgi:ABC-2 type transport system ATP-binding protein
MIRLENLTKSFNGKPALHGLSLKIARGEIFGLLGHNGAGKSTTFGIMLGQVHPDQGEAFINDHSVQHARSKALGRVGAIFETPGFYDYLSGWKNLEILSSYSARVKRSEISEAVEIVGLTDRIRDPVRVYSHGMRQRLALAQALLPAPEVILLDEPTEGLDPEGIHEIRSLIQRLNHERGLTVLLSSHLLSEVEQLCNRIAILNQGKLVFVGKWTELQGDAHRYRVEVNDWDHLLLVAKKMQVRIVDAGIVELLEDADVADFVKVLVLEGIKVRAITPLRANLEEIYLQMIGSGKNAHAAAPPTAAAEASAAEPSPLR